MPKTYSRVVTVCAPFHPIPSEIRAGRRYKFLEGPLQMALENLGEGALLLGNIGLPQVPMALEIHLALAKLSS